MRYAIIFLLLMAGCQSSQKLVPKPLTITEQVVAAATVEQKPLYASIMETKGLPFIFIASIAGGVFILIFLSKSDTGQRLGLALLGLGITGLVVTATYQRRAETIANWSAVIVISAICLGAIYVASLLYLKYVKARKVLKEVVVSSEPAFNALKEKLGKEATKALIWDKQSDETIKTVKEIKNAT